MVVAEGHADDALLFARARSGDRTAFALFVERNQDPLVSFLIHLTGSRERAEDLAQETFLRMLDRSRSYREQGKVLAYLYRIATNLVRSQERARRRRRLLSSIFLDNREAGPDRSQQHQLLARELRDELRRALARLPHPYRAVVILADVEERPHREIAELLGCREGTVKSRLHRGRLQLRLQLEDYWKGDRS